MRTKDIPTPKSISFVVGNSAIYSVLVIIEIGTDRVMYNKFLVDGFAQLMNDFVGLKDIVWRTWFRLHEY